MGHVAAQVLAASGAVQEVIIGDLDVRRAESVAQALGPKVTGRGVDVTDSCELGAALRKCDLVVNAVGPFFRFGASILSAAVDAACDYVDICDDWEPTLEMLALDDRARTAGVTALVGMGASPGVSNLLAVIAGRELDTVDSVATGWSMTVAAQPTASHASQPGAAIEHGMRQLSGTIRILQDGQFAERPALEKVVVDYPGIGRFQGRTFGHPEAVTLQRAFPGLRDNINITVGDRMTCAALSVLRFGINRRILTPRRAARIAAFTDTRHRAVSPTSSEPLAHRPCSPWPAVSATAGRLHRRPHWRRFPA
ncbi:saccharopine dehydrogenase family protein [Amycolatopsis albispora]|uniref:saccharopine dehydrogenase family protein n=1 Tax=Amycolatopsis albispora TaxID=1804986 RepID=UPI000DE32726|nr:saccharopine dehydrogenase NADP-binding domain-containing protein [Amycolatopsis albispora]